MDDLEVWIAFRNGEKVVNTPKVCTECGKEIARDDWRQGEWADGSGYICGKCGDEWCNHENN